MHHAVAATLFGRVQTCIGHLDGGVLVVLCGVGHGQPHADGDQSGGGVRRVLDRLAQFLGDQSGACLIGVGQQDEELLAAET